jgi:hypothetical protein
MGFWSFMKKVFSVSGRDDVELRQYREKHGINVDETEPEKREITNEPGTETYDPWEEIRNLRMNFFLGSWATRKFRPIGEEKLNKQLEDLEKKRQEEALKKQEGEGNRGG